jgi:hypothetical protein
VATFFVLSGLMWFMGFNEEINPQNKMRDEFDYIERDRHSRPNNDDRHARAYERY